MLTVRRDQMKVFEEESWRRLARRAERHLREYFPARCAALEPPELLARIDSAIGRGRTYDLDLSSDFLRFLNLAIVFGWDFDQRAPWAAEVLARTEFQPHTRMDMLSQRALDELHWTPVEPDEAQEKSAGEEPPEIDKLENEEMAASIDASEPEANEFEPEAPSPVWELDPEIDYKAHEEDFRDGA